MTFYILYAAYWNAVVGQHWMWILYILGSLLLYRGQCIAVVEGVCHKAEPKYKGLFAILLIYTNGSILIQCKNSTGKIVIRRLTPYYYWTE